MNPQGTITALSSKRPIILLTTLVFIISAAVILTTAYIVRKIIEAKQYVPSYIKNSKSPTLLCCPISNANDVKQSWFKNSFMIDQKAGDSGFVPLRSPTLFISNEGQIFGYVMRQVGDRYEWNEYKGQPIEWSSKHKRYIESEEPALSEAGSLSSINEIKPKKGFLSRFKRKKKPANEDTKSVTQSENEDGVDSDVECARASKQKSKSTTIAD